MLLEPVRRDAQARANVLEAAILGVAEAGRVGVAVADIDGGLAALVRGAGAHATRGARDAGRARGLLREGPALVGLSVTGEELEVRAVRRDVHAEGFIADRADEEVLLLEGGVRRLPGRVRPRSGVRARGAGVDWRGTAASRVTAASSGESGASAASSGESGASAASRPPSPRAPAFIAIVTGGATRWRASHVPATTPTSSADRPQPTSRFVTEPLEGATKVARRARPSVDVIQAAPGLQSRGGGTRLSAGASHHGPVPLT